jgi:hypothetical protein
MSAMNHARAFVVREGDPYDNGADYLSDERLTEVLRCVHDTELLPDLSVTEEADLVGEDKLIWDWNRPYLQHLYWLTEDGVATLKELEQKNGGHNA